MPRGRRRAIHSLVTALLVQGVVAWPGAAVAAPGGPAAQSSGTPAAGWQVGTARQRTAGHHVTLVTGDRVALDGPGAVGIEPGAGRDHIGFTQFERRGHQYVVPNDALRPVAVGQVDERLFDVTGLVADGYDDSRTTVLPTIVTYRDAGLARRGLRATPGARVTRALPAVDGAAVGVDKDTAGAFWSGITGGGAGTGPRAASGIAGLWLDGRRETSLDRSVPQIGAPTAWREGYDGTGVTVAVLDTGYDATHPDLAGKVTEAENFTSAPDTDDTVGHGTHVASTIVGSGARSGGRYRGVAPGASLVVGKVCDTRSCAESSILAGMEWGATRARVVNMSLGGDDEPGQDLLEQAVTRLTAETGALFVVAAGNDGPGKGSVDSPSTADAALSVGAVDKQDRMAGFSSRGPREDGAVKPEITAPGVDIVAARAAHAGPEFPETEPGYTQVSGTSMATPHVAGAAALLAGQHPDWRAADLKAALTESAVPTAGAGVDDQGAGRVDVARAVHQALLTTPVSLAMGTVPAPADDDTPTVRTVTYRNAGTTALTLDFAARVGGPDGTAVPDGMFTVAPSRATVAPGGSVAVTLTADTRLPSAPGTFEGALVATGADGVSARVPLTITKGTPTHRVTFHVRDRDGRAADTYLVGVERLDGSLFRFPYDGSGTFTVDLPEDTYGVEASVVTARDGSTTLLARPTLKLTGDTELTLDASTATPVSVTLARKAASLRLAAVGLTRRFTTGSYYVFRVTADSYAKLYTAALGDDLGQDDAGALVSDVRGFWARAKGDGTYDDSPYEYALVWFERGHLPRGFRRDGVRDRELAAVRQTYYSVNSSGRTAYQHNYGFPADGGTALSLAGMRFAVPGERTVYHTAEGVKWRGVLNQESAPGRAVETQFWADDTAYRAGRPSTVDWQRAVPGPRFNTATYVRRDGNRMSFNLPMAGDRAGHTGYSTYDDSGLTLYREGQPLVKLGYPWTDASGPVPAAESGYRLEYSARRSAATGGFEIGTEVSGAWTFRSGAPTDGTTALPLSAFDFAPVVDRRNTGGTPLVPVSLRRQPGAAASPVRRTTFEVSYDDGGSWHKAGTLRSGPDSWLVGVGFRPGAYVSLRASAVFADGGTVDYRVIRAYRLG